VRAHFTRVYDALTEVAPEHRLHSDAAVARNFPEGGEFHRLAPARPPGMAVFFHEICELCKADNPITVIIKHRPHQLDLAGSNVDPNLVAPA